MQWTERAYVTSSVVALSLGISLLTYCRVLQDNLPLWSKQRFVTHLELWRPFTALVYFGDFGMHSLWSTYLLGTYMVELETVYYSSSRKFFSRLCFIVLSLSLLNWFYLKAPLVSAAFQSAISYIWSRASNAEFSLLFFKLRATYLPWIQLLLNYKSKLFLSQIVAGIVVGHLVYFADFVVKNRTSGL